MPDLRDARIGRDRRRGEAGAPGEARTVAGAFLVYGGLFVDRLAPLYLLVPIAEELDAPAAALGTVALAVGLGWAGSMVLARAASGRWDDRRRILAGACLSAACSVVSAAAGAWVVFVVLRGLGGLVAGSAAPPVTSLVFAAVPPQRRGRGIGIVQSSTRIGGNLLAPVVVTGAGVAWGWRPALLVAAAISLMGAVLLAVLVRHAPAPARRPRRAPPPPLGLHPGGRRDIAVSAVAAVLLLGFLFTLSQSGVPLLRGWLAVSADTAGRLLGLFGIGAAAAALGVPLISDRVGRRAALAGASVLGGVAGIGFAFAAGASAALPTAVVGALLLVAGTGMGGLALVISLIPAEAVASGDVGRALAVPIVAAEVLGAATVPAVAGAVGARVGLAEVVGGASCGLLLVAALSALLRPRSRAGATAPRSASPPRPRAGPRRRGGATAPPAPRRR